MAYDLQEQEQLDDLKAWWKKYGTPLLAVVTLVMLGFAAHNGWRWYQRDQARTAAGVYAQFEQAVQANDPVKAQTIAGSLMEHYGRTAYAPMAALQSARLSAESANLPKAAEQLRWVIDQSGHEELTMLARVRLAGVLLDMKQYDEALKALDFVASDTYLPAVLDRRGDVLAAQGKTAEARAAWTDALAKADAGHPLRAIVQLKLDALPPAALS